MTILDYTPSWTKGPATITQDAVRSTQRGLIAISNKRTSFYSIFLSVALGLLAAGPVTDSSINVVLGFGGSTCVGPCGNGAQVSQDAGDVAGAVDVIFDAKRDTGPPQ